MATLAAQLYPLTKEGEVFVWTPDHQKAFEEIKKALLTASLGLCLTQPSPSLFMWKREQGSPEESLLRLWDLKKASGLPIQEVTPCCQRVVFLPESYCCHNLLVKDADKLTLGQQITVVASHTLESIILKPPD